MNIPSFFLIWNPSGSRPPRIRHADRGAAMVEARRLAVENPGQTFIVLESISSVTCGRMVIEHFAVDEDMRIPF